MNEILKKIENEIIVSLQAMPNEPLYDENCIIALAKSIIDLGGAKALRLAGARDIKNIKKLYPNVFVIGITKPNKIPKNYKELVYITPNIKNCAEIIEAGADIVAFDGTNRPRGNNETLEDLINFIHSKNKLAMADIATLDEAINCAKLGCDIISTTLSGYTTQTQNMPDTPDFELVKNIKKNCDVFVIQEGKIWEKNEAIHAFKCGANSVVIGSAITRPQLITKRFINAIKGIKNE